MEIFGMKHKFLFITICVMISSIKVYATDYNADDICFYATPNTTYRFEVFYDRSFPDIYFCIQNGTDVKYLIKDSEADIDGTEIQVRQVETISGQNFSVVYFTCGVEGTYSIEYSNSDNSTFVLAETSVNQDYLTNPREKRQDVTKIYYDIVGPYTDISLETLLDINYNPYSSDAKELIKDKEVDNTIYIPINAFTISFVILFFSAILFYFVRKHIIKLRDKENEIVHSDLLDMITSSQIATEEQNEDLKNYWNIIKNDFAD